MWMDSNLYIVHRNEHTIGFDIIIWPCMHAQRCHMCLAQLYLRLYNVTDQKNIFNVKNWPGEPPKSVEIRNQMRAYNSNPLQRYEHAGTIHYSIVLYIDCVPNPSTTSFHAGHQYGPYMSLRMDELCVPVLNTACIRNINSSQIIMIICMPAHNYIGIGHHPTSITLKKRFVIQVVVV